jgi:hypothetical protein
MIRLKNKPLRKLKEEQELGCEAVNPYMVRCYINTAGAREGSFWLVSARLRITGHEMVEHWIKVRPAGDPRAEASYFNSKYFRRFQ